MHDEVNVNPEATPAEPAATLPAPTPPDGRLRAAVVLEVLAGVRTPQDAARVLDLALPSYYLLEGRALEGLVEACAPRKRGRNAAEAAPDVERLRMEVTRQQSLIRSMQKSLGLMAPPDAPVTGRRARRPAVRALRAAKKLMS